MESTVRATILAIISAIAMTGPVVAESGKMARTGEGGVIACPNSNDYLRFNDLLGEDKLAAINFATDHKCVMVEPNTMVRVMLTMGGMSCIRSLGQYDCMWTSASRIKGE